MILSKYITLPFETYDSIPVCKMSVATQLPEHEDPEVSVQGSLQRQPPPL